MSSYVLKSFFSLSLSLSVCLFFFCFCRPSISDQKKETKTETKPPESDRQVIETKLKMYLLQDIVHCILMPYLGEHPIYDVEFFRNEYPAPEFDENEIKDTQIKDTPSKCSFLDIVKYHRLPPSVFPSVQCVYFCLKSRTTSSLDLSKEVINEFLNQLSSVFMIVLDGSEWFYPFEVNCSKIRCVIFKTPRQVGFYDFDPYYSNWDMLLTNKCFSECDEIRLPNGAFLLPKSRTCLSTELDYQYRHMNTFVARHYECPNLVSFSFLDPFILSGKRDQELKDVFAQAVQRILPQLTTIKICDDTNISYSLLSSLATSAQQIFMTLDNINYQNVSLPSSLQTLSVFAPRCGFHYLAPFLKSLVTSMSTSFLSQLRLQLCEFHLCEIRDLFNRNLFKKTDIELSGFLSIEWRDIYVDIEDNVSTLTRRLSHLTEQRSKINKNKTTMFSFQNPSASSPFTFRKRY
jgi:hypothetical protein